MKTLDELGISPPPWMTWQSNRKRVKDSRGFAIADCDYENAEDAANARLISAAPELYECLRIAYLHMIGEYDYNGCEVRKFKEALDKASGAEVEK